MTPRDTVSRRVESLVVNGIAEAHGAASHPVRCQSCGALTDTRDGYRAPTPLGEVWVCPACNADPLLWTADEVFFTGTGARP